MNYLVKELGELDEDRVEYRRYRDYVVEDLVCRLSGEPYKLEESTAGWYAKCDTKHAVNVLNIALRQILIKASDAYEEQIRSGIANRVHLINQTLA